MRVFGPGGGENPAPGKHLDRARQYFEKPLSRYEKLPGSEIQQLDYFGKLALIHVEQKLRRSSREGL